MEAGVESQFKAEAGSAEKASDLWIYPENPRTFRGIPDPKGFRTKAQP
jgi:hypothetical protein